MGDQGIVSVGNFVTFNLLARSLPAEQYGAFGVTLESILFLNSLQSALVVYPMTVQGATRGALRLQKLVSGSLLFTLILLPVLGSLTGLATRTSATWPTAFCAVFAMLMWQTQETTRRALMADLRFRSVVWGDACSYLGQAAAVFVLSRTNTLALGTAFIVMGLTSLLAAVVQLLQLRVRMVRIADLRLQARDCWKLGRWMLLSNLGAIVTNVGYLWTLRFSRGLDAVATFAALFAVTKLANPVTSSLCGIITPAAARASAAGGPRASIKVALKYVVLGGVIVTIPFTFVFIMPAATLRMLYGAGSPYIVQAHLLRLVLPIYAMMYISFVTSAWLSGLGHSRAGFVAQCVTVVATVSIPFPLTVFFGVPGLLWGALIALFCGAAAGVGLLLRVLSKSSEVLRLQQAATLRGPAQRYAA
jgi:O-antigen/teichoic acid export membrane protein